MRGTVLKLLLVVLAVGLAACADDAQPGSDTTAAADPDRPVANACPPEGCEITITDVAAQGDELLVTWEANFDPDVSRNHIHIYWDTYTADEVSSDAEARGMTQGDWHPTDAYPTYVTESGASVANRGESTTLCVTAADRDHAVLDSSIVDCRDVSAVLP